MAWSPGRTQWRADSGPELGDVEVPAEIRWSVRLFGTLSLAGDGRLLGLRDFSGVKPRQLLEILLVYRQHPVPRDKLAELLWSAKLPSDVSGTLATYVSILRRCLGYPTIVTEPEAYRLAIQFFDVDLDRFDRLVEDAGRSSTRKARPLLDEALSLATAEPLEHEPYAEWATDPRGTYRARVLGARLSAAEAALAERDFQAATRHADEAIRIDRFSEQATRVQMLALYGAQRQADALAAYESLRSRLDDELGLLPLSQTKELQGRCCGKIRSIRSFHRHETRARPGRARSGHSRACPPSPSRPVTIEFTRSTGPPAS